MALHAVRVFVLLTIVLIYIYISQLTPFTLRAGHVKGIAASAVRKISNRATRGMDKFVVLIWQFTSGYSRSFESAG